MLPAMKHRFPILLVALSLLLSAVPGLAAETNDISKELRSIVVKINDKLRAGLDTEKDLAEELKEFDTLLARHKDAAPIDRVQILVSKGQVYLEVLNEPDKALALLRRIKRDFPGVEVNGSTDGAIRAVEYAVIQRTLVEGAEFPDFNEKDLDGKPLSTAGCKGKVVLIDFWATWCPPCLVDLPQLSNAYEKHHDQGFEIIGISLDDDLPKLRSFLKDKNVPWRQFFDGLHWKNKLAVKYGVDSTPTTYLLDRQGRIIAKNLRGVDLEKAVARALATR